MQIWFRFSWPKWKLGVVCKKVKVLLRGGASACGGKTRRIPSSCWARPCPAVSAWCKTSQSGKACKSLSLPCRCSPWPGTATWCCSWSPGLSGSKRSQPAWFWLVRFPNPLHGSWGTWLGSDPLVGVAECVSVVIVPELVGHANIPLLGLASSHDVGLVDDMVVFASGSIHWTLLTWSSLEQPSHLGVVLAIKIAIFGPLEPWIGAWNGPKWS